MGNVIPLFPKRLTHILLTAKMMAILEKRYPDVYTAAIKFKVKLIICPWLDVDDPYLHPYINDTPADRVLLKF